MKGRRRARELRPWLAQAHGGQALLGLGRGGPGLSRPLCISVLSFPAEHFGKLFGLAMALSALVSLLQFPIFMLIRGPLGGDPFYVSTWQGPGAGLSGEGAPTGKGAPEPAEGPEGEGCAGLAGRSL